MRRARRRFLGAAWLVLAASGCQRDEPIPDAVARTQIVAGFTRQSGEGGAEAASLAILGWCNGTLTHRAVPSEQPPRHIAQGPGGRVFIATGREVRTLDINGGTLEPAIVALEGPVDSVLPLRDGRRLALLEHPPSAAHRSEAIETGEPHHLRFWDLREMTLVDSVELHPLAYELFDAGDRVLVTHLQGREIELCSLPPPPGAPATQTLVPPASRGMGTGPGLLRSCAVTPDARWAFLAENGIGGDPARVVLWTLDLKSLAFTESPVQSRGLFQRGIALVPARDDGTTRLILNAVEKCVILSGRPETGFIEERSFTFPERMLAYAVAIVRGESPDRVQGLWAIAIGCDGALRSGRLAVLDLEHGPLRPPIVLERPMDVASLIQHL